jgi:aryl-alcohol dehydrogenase-like predicted oxidoreductase
MESRNLGTQGLSVAAIGLGCMGMTHAYGTRDDAESIATIHRALDAGVTLLDTAEAYGPHTNEELVGKAIKGRRAQVVLATKFGIKLSSDGVASVDGTPANAKRAVEGSLKRLGVEVVDLYYLHSADEMTANDFRRTLPRFTNENLAANARIVEALKAVAARHGATPAQIALAWVLAQGKDVVPIPGTKRRQYLDENLGAAKVTLNNDDLADLKSLASIVSGERYPAHAAKLAER